MTIGVILRYIMFLYVIFALILWAPDITQCFLCSEVMLEEMLNDDVKCLGSSHVLTPVSQVSDICTSQSCLVLTKSQMSHLVSQNLRLGR